MPACPQCKATIEEGARFCGSCGANIAKATSGEDKPLPVAHVDQLLGNVLNDRYRIDKKIGEGGFGAVFEATHLQMERQVAVKVLHPHLTKDPNLAQRFRQREAQAARKLRDAHTVNAYDFDMTKGGVLYLVMELIRGRSLLAEIQQHGALPAQRVVFLVDQICSSLMEAHSQGIIHRDIKPENILIEDRASQRDFIKVADFGIAKVMGDDSPVATLTGTGQIIGTLEYMSPEQLAGGSLDHRSDIYALGVLMYQMLTGTVPFGGAPASVITGHIHQQPEPLSAKGAAIPATLERVVMRCLAKDAGQRYPDVAALRADLAGCADATAARAAAIPATRIASGAAATPAPATIAATGRPQGAFTGPGAPAPSSPPPAAVGPRPSRPAAGAQATTVVGGPSRPVALWAAIGGGGLLALALVVLGLWMIFSDGDSPGSWPEDRPLGRLAPRDAALRLHLRPQQLMQLPGLAGAVRPQVNKIAGDLGVTADALTGASEALIVLATLPQGGSESDGVVALKGVAAAEALEKLKKRHGAGAQEQLEGFTLQQLGQGCALALNDKTIFGGDRPLVARALKEALTRDDDGGLGGSDAVATLRMKVPAQEQQKLRGQMARQGLQLPANATVERVSVVLEREGERWRLDAALHCDASATAVALSGHLGRMMQQLRLASSMSAPQLAKLIERIKTGYKAKQVTLRAELETSAIEGLLKTMRGGGNLPLFRNR